MKILHISDTHGFHRRLSVMPEADVLIHSGDFTMNGSVDEAVDFLHWFCDQPYRHKIFICGNHDNCLYGANIAGLDANVHYLCNSSIEIDGVKFYGVPMFLEECITGRQSRNYASIPVDTDVLITHAPPYKILDFADGINYGETDINASQAKLNLKTHLFGHIHVAHGIETSNGTIFSNAAILAATLSDFYSPNIIEI